MLGVDDAAETFLIRLSRASGINGLAQMAELGQHGCTRRTAAVRHIRPLLQVHKAELMQLCKENGLAWCEDPTNADTRFSRNMIRRLLQRRGGAASPHPPPLPASRKSADPAGIKRAPGGTRQLHP